MVDSNRKMVHTNTTFIAENSSQMSKEALRYVCSAKLNIKSNRQLHFLLGTNNQR